MGYETVEFEDRQRVFYRQEEGQSCGPACVCTVVTRMGQGNPTERSIIALSRENRRTGYQPEFKDRPGVKAVMPAVRVRNEPALRYAGRLGTCDENLREVLVKQKIAAQLASEPTQSRIESLLNRACYDRPAIVLLERPAHFIVCDGPSVHKKGGLFGKRHWIFCDPDYPHGRTGKALYGRMDGTAAYFHDLEKTAAFRTRILSIISITGLITR